MARGETEMDIESAPGRLFPSLCGDDQEGTNSWFITSPLNSSRAGCLINCYCKQGSLFESRERGGGVTWGQARQPQGACVNSSGGPGCPRHCPMCHAISSSPALLSSLTGTESYAARRILTQVWLRPGASRSEAGVEPGF